MWHYVSHMWSWLSDRDCQLNCFHQHLTKIFQKLKSIWTVCMQLKETMATVSLKSTCYSNASATVFLKPWWRYIWRHSIISLSSFKHLSMISNSHNSFFHPISCTFLTFLPMTCFPSSVLLRNGLIRQCQQWNYITASSPCDSYPFPSMS